MVRSIVFIFLIVLINVSDCQITSVAIEKPSLCITGTYIVPLFSTKIIRTTFNRTYLKQLNIHEIHIYAIISDQKVAEFENHRSITEKTFRISNNTKLNNNKPMIVYNLKINANYMNRTYIHYSIRFIDTNNHTYHINCSSILIVSSPKRLIDTIFKNVIPFIIIFTSIQMGILLDVGVLKELIKRPIQVLIGFVCQYGMMPILAYTISKLFRYDPLYGLGLFVVGCCPGGSASNQWTVIFDGDLNLSVFMSFASTVASFFMMPFWLYTLGQYAYLEELKIRIPFLNLAQSLLTIIAPVGIGMLLVHCIPKLKSIIQRIVKPTLILIIFYFFVFGAFANYYLLRYIDLRTALTAPLLPWLGFGLGGFLAWVFKQDEKRIITIGIETGIQNIGIAFMILLYSLPAPDNSQATVMPLVVAYLSLQPLYILLIYQTIRRKCCKSEKSVDTLSKTTPELSEVKSEVLDNEISLPLTAAGLSAGSEAVKIV
ncbi:unnamed protein product [Adineta steineri]|uniref:Uncharacterized protein n=1 Tax=Adineta steineri TaxID=433720 RepID=A0A818RJ45_9BILA|nr:unnamed protein product [Adineta steineri]